MRTTGRVGPNPASRPRVATPRASAPAVALPQIPRLVDVVCGLPDARWLERLLRGRAWIALIAVALIGLVFMQVSMLKMNAGIGQSVERSATLERQNADLRANVSQLSSEERIQRAAADMGLLMPPAGDIRYLQSSGVRRDAAKAAQMMRAPTPEAQQTAAVAAGVAAGEQAQATPPPTDAAVQAAQAQAQVQPQASAPQTAAPAQPQQQAPATPPAQAPPAQPQQSAAAAPPPQQSQAAPQAGAAVAPGPGQ